MNKKTRNIIIIISSVLIVAILAVAIGMLISITTFVKEKKQASQDVIEQEQEEEKEEVPIEEEEENKDITFTISAVGDLILATDINYMGAGSFVSVYNQQQDPSYFLRNVQSVFANDDLTIGNFEGTITTLETRQDKQFAFKSAPEYVNILTTSSVEAVNLANNHSRDYGMQSLADTRSYLTEAGITHFGYDQSVVIEKKGIKIGLVGIYSMPDGLGRLPQLKEEIEEVKSQGAQITIVTFHWGVEGIYRPRDTEVQLAHAAIDNGADLVLGAHAHVLQGIENYQSKKIVYGLGNFCFGGNRNPSDKDTMIFQQTFTIRDGQILNHDDINIIPCSISSVKERNNFQPTILEGTEKERVMNKIREISAGLSADGWTF